MLGILATVVCCWLLFTAVRLMFKIAWGMAKVFAIILVILAIPTLIEGLLITGGVLLLLPVAMLLLAIILLKH